jgi:transposase
VPVSDLCDQHNIHVNTFYHWLKIFFDNGTAAFEANSKPKAAADAKDKKIEQLEAKLIRKNEVVAEFLEAHTTLKKSRPTNLAGRSRNPLGIRWVIDRSRLRFSSESCPHQ